MSFEKPLVTSYIESKGLVRQHITSFNYFISKELKNILFANQLVDSDIDSSFFLKYTDIYVSLPSTEENMFSYDITPHECRLRDLTYSAFVYVDIEYVKSKTIVAKKKCCIGKIPVMLRSEICHLNRHSSVSKTECSLDAGGYFIINGVERVILIQEQTSKNRMMLEEEACAVTSSTHNRKSKTLVIKKKGSFYLKNNAFAEDVPLVIAIKALGILSDKEIVSYVGEELEEKFASSIEECAKNKVFTEDQAYQFISNLIKARSDSSKVEEARNIMTEVILPNVMCDGINYRVKGIYIALMARKLLLSQNDIQSDKDFVGNKRFELAGQLLAIMFEDLFKRYNTELKKSIDKVLSKRSRAQEFDAVTFINLQVNLITMGFVRAISTGNWIVKRFRMEKKGVTQVLSRLSYISALGMMGRINSQFEKTRKISGPRSLHTSQWGMLCPADTPEGESCGLVKNLALMSEITSDSNFEELKTLILKLGVYSIDLPCNLHKNTFILFLDGMIIGTVEDSDIFIRNFKDLRRDGKINKFVSVSKNQQQRIINVSGDGGRIVRPLIIVRKEGNEYISSITDEDIELLNQKYIIFDDLVENGKIEYLDSNELGDSLVALYPDNLKHRSHLEIAPFTILGTVAGLIPYPHHNQSPRNTYQCAMGKQAMGYIGYNQYKRFDTLLYILTYSQRPLVQSQTIELTNFTKLPAGINGIIAVMSYSGYDIEDALILNKSSIERGLGRCEIYKNFSVSLKRYSDGSLDRIMPGGKTQPIDESKKESYGSFFSRYREETIDIDGLASPGQRIFDNQIYLNMESPSGTSGEYKFSGMVYKGKSPSYIDKVLITKSGEDNLMIKTLIRQTRIPEIGDKFSSRHGQKGVVGLIVPAEDLPFSESGLIPDIIMNPHGFPSRMTVGKIIELISGKAALLTGDYRDSSAFCDAKIDEIEKILTSNGYNYSGKDIFYSGTTGKIMTGYVFFGPVYYQKLKHMVADKIHSRARGPRAILTRQPTEGRSRDGGLRLGEMERDCLIGYGASGLLIERLLVSSDLFECKVCRKCGVITMKKCQLCNEDDIADIRIPYACKLLFQELISMNILPRLHIKPY